MSSNHNEIPVNEDVESYDEELEEILTPTDSDSNSLDPHSAPTVILIPPRISS